MLTLVIKASSRDLLGGEVSSVDLSKRIRRAKWSEFLDCLSSLVSF